MQRAKTKRSQFEPSSIPHPFLQELVFTHEFRGGTQGVSGLVPGVCLNPHSPSPLPRPGSAFHRTENFGRGRGVNSDVTSTQGGALMRLPWATIGDPFRVEDCGGVQNFFKLT